MLIFTSALITAGLLLSVLVRGQETRLSVQESKWNKSQNVQQAFSNPTYAANADLYDPHSCRESWISYIKSDLLHRSQLVEWDNEMETFLNQHSRTGWREHLVTNTHTVIETIWSPAPTPTQCDNFPRVVSISRRTSMAFGTETSIENLYDVPPPPQPSDQPEIPQFPTCQINPLDCTKQWDLFQDSFRNWTTTFAEVVQNSLTMYCIMDGHSSEYCEMNNIFDINSWITYRQFPSFRGFFSGCPQVADVCYANYGHDGIHPLDDTRDTTKPTQRLTLDCDVSIDRFVLIYFPSPLKRSRDLCSDGGYGEDINRNHVNDTMIMTATLNSIVFQAKEVLKPYASLKDYRGYQDAGLFATRLPRSTMTGKFTFTSPSVYLAYDTIAADGVCKHPGSILKNSILTLHPSELSSVVHYYSPTCHEENWEGPTSTVCGMHPLRTTRSFNLLDLQGPVPANAYFEGLKSAYISSTRGSFEGECSYSICEDQYYPTVAIPRIVTKLEPAFADCHPFKDELGRSYTDKPLIQGVWDPPIILTPVPSTEEGTITILAENSLAVEATAAPGSALNIPNSPQMTNNVPGNFPVPPGHPNSPARTSLESERKPTSHLGALIDASPTAIITLGNSVFTASVLQDRAYVLIGTHTLQAGGSPSVIAGATVSYGQNGRLDVGTSETYYLGHAPTPTTVLQINGRPVTVAVDAVGSGQRGSLVIGTVILKPGSPATLVNGRSLSFGVDGVLYDGTQTIATISWNSLATNRLSSAASKSGISGSSRTGLFGFGDTDSDSPGLLSEETFLAKSGNKKKSGAGRLSDTLPCTLTFLGLVVGAWLRLRHG